MAKYGVDYYGTAYYGAGSNSVAFNATNFTAQPTAYGQIQLDWGTPAGAWDYFRLVRSQYGYPVSPDDGDLLLESIPGPTRYINSGQTPVNVKLKPGKKYYYSIFVRQTSDLNWKTAGNTSSICVKDYGTAQLMLDYLPDVLKSNIPYDTALEVTNDVLYRFLKLFAFQIDLYRSQIDSVANRYDVANLDGSLIPVMMDQFGIKFEPYLGLKQSRIYLQNIARLYQNKGTLLGLREFIKAYGGYDSTITMGKNLMLDQNDSSFEQSIGSWASISNATLARHLATDSPTITPYYESSSQPGFPNLQKATLQVTATASADTTIALSGTTPIYYGIPVTPATSYTFTAYSQAGTTGRAVSAQIYWYDNAGNALTPSTAGSTTSTTTGTWRRITSAVTSPANAAYAVPRIKIASTAASEVHYFDCLQFEQASSATFFQDARQIEIVLIANRINELTNPNFESSTTGWTATNGTFSLTVGEGESVESHGSVNVSGGAMEIYASAAGLVTLSSSALNILASNNYTFSIYCSASEIAGDSKMVTPYISWYDSTSTLISTSTGTAISAGNTYVRPFVSDVAPVSAVTAKVGITWTATAAGGELTGNEITVDAALFERSAYMNSYFDGSNGVTESADLYWEGTANLSRSHYYRNGNAVQNRLIAKIPDWTNYGSTFELFVAQPNT